MIWYLLWRVLLLLEIATVAVIGAASYSLFINIKTYPWVVCQVISLVLLIYIEKKVKPKADRKYGKTNGNSWEGDQF
jgi:FtsH-binding integral membrane protein